MSDSILAAIKERRTVTHFRSDHEMSDGDIRELVELATRAPSSFNLQNWRFIAVRSPEAKARLRPIAWDQEKITAAAVTFIVVGVLADHETMPARLTPAVQYGIMSAQIAEGWQGAAKRLYFEQQWRARDEAVRSATFAAGFLILAAHAKGLGAGPMIGFDDEPVSREFGLAVNEIPVLLLSVGLPADGNWPQKPRRPVAEITELV
ncbi:nitroreductase family protein [Mycobacterium sp. 236(2023)]|uniref:nitroreductase family protein n=1 Tax=Mycobacterium sp. 236(2023) TaxID=3038163 RepID=UPI0024158DE1|nr:nitroreductase family protein [Mycobacterium sp. 236(2023)]MDG4665508.1 nitroreductase family protein [Mycobacterium sp. 236(2023)]